MPSALRTLRGLIPYLRPHAGTLARASALLVVATGLQLAGPLLVRRAFDVDIPAGDARGLALTAGGFVASLLVAMALHVVLRSQVETVGQAVLLELRRKLFARLVRQSLSFHVANPPGKLIARVQGDTEALRQLFAGATVTLVSAGVYFVGMTIVLLAVEPRLAALALALLVLVLGSSFALLSRGVALETELRSRAADVTGHVAERVQGVAALQAFAREAQAAEEVDRLGRAKHDVQWRSWSYAMAPHQVQSILDLLAAAAAVGLGGVWVLRGELTFGTLMLGLDCLRRLHEPLAHATEQVVAIQRAVASGARVLALLDEPISVLDPESPRRLGPLERGIEFRGVSFSYAGTDERALREASFTVPRGQTWAIVGATGSGKSTIFNLLLRFHDPQQGAVLLDGVDVRELAQAELRARMALVLQDAHLFPGDLLQNLAPSGVVADEREAARLREAAAAVGLDAVVARLPGGWHADVAERGANLSAGERQLVTLARAVARDPEVLLLDEATASVDPRTEAAIQLSLARLLAGRTALVIAHRLSTVRHSDGILVLDRGRVVERGTHDELMARGGAYAALHAAQLAHEAVEEAS